MNRALARWGAMGAGDSWEWSFCAAERGRMRPLSVRKKIENLGSSLWGRWVGMLVWFGLLN